MLGGLPSIGQGTQLGRVVLSSLWLHVTVFHLVVIRLCYCMIVCTSLNVTKFAPHEGAH